ncbi:hypothetical protein [Methylocapsa palsarum]|uniref:hypothetical protein n=1 Tax=Methylocapsa palsarum TaxID=1612308 RepID=UPI001FCD38FB|nr:hypothetical protein [Methylocapsa palsarum]
MKISLIQMNSVSDKAANIAAAVLPVEQACAKTRGHGTRASASFDTAARYNKVAE